MMFMKANCKLDVAKKVEYFFSNTVSMILHIQFDSAIGPTSVIFAITKGPRLSFGD